MPRKLSKSHGFKLVDVINKCWGYVMIIAVDGTVHKKSAVVGFEATDNASVSGLDVQGEVGLEGYNTNIGEVRQYNVATEIILQQQNVIRV
jgi:hypothetical protein